MTPAVARSSNLPRDVGEVMAKDVVTCRPGETLGAVASRMLGEDVACTPVLDAAGGRRVVGMLTDRDICTAAAAQRVPLDGITVEDAMRGPVRICWAVDSLVAAEAIAFSERHESGRSGTPFVVHRTAWFKRLEGDRYLSFR